MRCCACEHRATTSEHLCPVRIPSGKTAEGAGETLALLRKLGDGHALLSSYRCKARFMLEPWNILLAFVTSTRRRP